MVDSPVITDILTIPGSGDGSLSVGMVIDDSRVIWGACSLDGATMEDVDASLATIREVVAPTLVGRPLTGFRHMAAGLESLSQPITVSETLPEPPTGKRPESISRRDLFTGRLGTSTVTPPVKTRQVTVERPLSPAIRYGLSATLLQAAATVEGTTMAEVIGREYGQDISLTPVPFYVETDGDEAMLAQAMENQISTLGYTLPGQNAVVELGEGASVLRKYIQTLSQWVLAVAGPSYRPALHINVRGGLGETFDNNVGRVLGFLFGLKSVAAKLPLRVEDPFIMDDQETQIEAMKQLKNYIRFRKLGIQLVAGTGMDSLSDIQAYLAADAADMVRIEARRLGSVSQTVVAILACREQGVQVLLTAEDGRMAKTVAHIALAVQPELVTGMAPVYDEMRRTLAWLERQQRMEER